MRRIVTVFGLLCLSGCASWFRSAAREVAALPAAPEKKEVIVQAPPPASREPGSIWSDTSQWNVLYSPPLQRTVGDVVTLKPTDNFRLTVAHRAGNGPGWEQVQSGRENSQILAVIKEVLPRQIYRIEAKQSVKVGTKDHDIELAGKIREQDISSDDTGTTDHVFELDLKVKTDSQVAQTEPPAPARGLAGVPGTKPDDVAPPLPVESAKPAKVASKEGEK